MSLSVELDFTYDVGQVATILNLIDCGMQSKTISRLENFPLHLVKQLRSNSWAKGSSVVVQTSRHGALCLFKLYNLQIPDCDFSWSNDLSRVNILLSRQQVLHLANSYDSFVHDFV